MPLLIGQTCSGRAEGCEVEGISMRHSGVLLYANIAIGVAGSGWTIDAPQRRSCPEKFEALSVPETLRRTARLEGHGQSRY